MGLKEKSIDRLKVFAHNLVNELNTLYRARSMLPQDSFLGYFGICMTIRQKEHKLAKIVDELKTRGVEWKEEVETSEPRLY